MNFNTAIFYDIENLLKGYAFSPQTIANLSLKDILNAIKQTNRIGEIAVQRAYANWSDPRLGFMRGEINQLGIEPVQVFGFSQDQKKNAADIQLVVDAIDLAHVRQAIEVFVIVSGDGGFATLAKKLHEYGRTVIGCGYHKATNSILRAVCDEFVWIADPEENAPVRNHISGQVNDPSPRVKRVINKIQPLTRITEENLLAKIQEIFSHLENDAESEAELKRTGIHLSVIREAIKCVIPEFTPLRSGFPKFVEFLQYACANTKFCIARKLSTEAMLTLRNAVPAGYDILPDLDPSKMDNLETYKKILAAPTGVMFKLPSASDLAEVACWIVQRPLNGEELGTGIEVATNMLYPTVNAEAVKAALLAFVAAGAFEIVPEGATLSEQKLTLRQDLRSKDLLLSTLRGAARAKLESFLPEVKEQFLKELI